MNSSVKAKQEELVASLDKFAVSLKENLSQKLVEAENSIDNMQAELKAARATQAQLNSELLTYKGQYNDLEKFIAAEEKRPKACPQCNYPLQNLFKCCPMCGTPIPEAGDPNVDYLIPAGAVNNQNAGASKLPPSPAAMAGTSNLPPSPAAGKSLPPSPAAMNAGGQTPPPPPSNMQKQFPNFAREADRGDKGASTPPPAQKQFPNFNREADRGDAGSTIKQEEVDNASGFLSRFGFGGKKKPQQSTPSQPINLGQTPPPVPPTPSSQQTPPPPAGASGGSSALPPPPPPKPGMPVKQFPNFNRESDRGNTVQSSPQQVSKGISVPPPSRGVSVPPPSGNQQQVPPPAYPGAVPPVPPVPPVPAYPGSVPPVPPVQKPVEPEAIVVDAKDITIENTAAGEAATIEKTPIVTGGGAEAKAENLDSFKSLYKFHESATGYVIDKYIGTGNSKIIIPGSVDGKTVVAIAARAFLQNDEIVSVVLGGGIKLIGSEAFYGCSSLKQVELPDTVDKIKSGAFMDCPELVDVVMPSQMTDIGAYAFANDKSIVSMTFPNGLKWISEFTMSKCSGLKNITLPDGIRAIETSAFMECSSLEGVDMPISLVSIGDKAFYNCRSLNKVVMPPSITRLGTRIFFPKMGQNMIPKLTVFCSNGSEVHEFCKKNSIKSKASPDMPATAPTLKNAAYAIEIAYWMKDKDEIAIKEMKDSSVKALDVADYEADDFFVEEEGYCKELHTLLPVNMSIEEAESLCEKLPTSCYVQVIHAYDGKIDEAAKNSQSPF